MNNILSIRKLSLPLQPQNKSNGAIAQMVEQRTENPCVPGSIPGGTTERELKFNSLFFVGTYHIRLSLNLFNASI